MPSEYQTDWVQIRPDILSGLIWVQFVCKGYEQMTLAGNDLIRLGNDSHHFMNTRKLTLRKFIDISLKRNKMLAKIIANLFY